MRNQKNKLIKGIRIFVIIFALTFSSSMNASTALTWGSGWWNNWWGSWGGGHTHYRGCGHSGYGGGSQGGGDSIPLDGGLGILLVGAAAFGIKKLRENKNEEI